MNQQTNEDKKKIKNKIQKSTFETFSNTEMEYFVNIFTNEEKMKENYFINDPKKSFSLVKINFLNS
jgi:hypothetical protein